MKPLVQHLGVNFEDEKAPPAVRELASAVEYLRDSNVAKIIDEQENKRIIHTRSMSIKGT